MMVKKMLFFVFCCPLFLRSSNAHSLEFFLMACWGRIPVVHGTTWSGETVLHSLDLPVFLSEWFVAKITFIRSFTGVGMDVRANFFPQYSQIIAYFLSNVLLAKKKGKGYGMYHGTV